MNEWIIMVLGICSILVVVGLLVVLLLWEKKKGDVGGEVNYKAFFLLGLNFVSIGVVFIIVVSPAFVAFLGIGVCYIFIGLAHKDEWNQEVLN